MVFQGEAGSRDPVFVPHWQTRMYTNELYRFSDFLNMHGTIQTRLTSLFTASTSQPLPDLRSSTAIDDAAFFGS